MCHLHSASLVLTLYLAISFTRWSSWCCGSPASLSARSNSWARSFGSFHSQTCKRKSCVQGHACVVETFERLSWLQALFPQTLWLTSVPLQRTSSTMTLKASFKKSCPSAWSIRGLLRSWRQVGSSACLSAEVRTVKCVKTAQVIFENAHTYVKLCFPYFCPSECSQKRQQEECKAATEGSCS